MQYPRHRVVKRIGAALPRTVMARRLMREIQAAHGGMADEAVRDAASAQYRAHAVAQLGAVVGNPLERIGVIENLQSFLRSGQRYRVRRVGASVGDAAA